jgi:hypothetical protein
MKLKLNNKKTGVSEERGGFLPRVYHKASKGKYDPRYLIKCGCCDKSVEIYYGDDSLEINGVMASVESWKKILLPLLNINDD